MRRGLTVISSYLDAYHLSPASALLRLDGQYGTGAVLADLAGFAFVTRGKEYTVLDHPLVQARLHLPPDQLKPRPESQIVRSLYDCASCAGGVCGRALSRGGGDSMSPAPRRARLASRGRASSLNSSSARCESQAFTASDVIEVYLHRGALRACAGR